MLSCAADAWWNSKDNDNDQLHDQIPIEAQAIQKNNIMIDFLKANDFVRKRKTKKGIKIIPDNRVLNLLKALDDAKDKNQRERYKANQA